MRKLLTVCLLTLMVMGCSTVRDWRTGQETVPVHQPITAQQREVERQAADYLARSVESPEEAKPVAEGLSGLMGKPVDELNDTDLLVKGLRAELSASRKRIDALEGWMRDNEGKTIEGTGWQPFGWLPGTSWLWIAGIIAFVAIGGLSIVGPLFSAMFKLRRTVRSVVRGVENFSLQDPIAAKQLKQQLKGVMPPQQQIIIDKEKLRI